MLRRFQMRLEFVDWQAFSKAEQFGAPKLGVPTI
jgi:hypothetical protein